MSDNLDRNFSFAQKDHNSCRGFSAVAEGGGVRSRTCVVGRVSSYSASRDSSPQYIDDVIKSRLRQELTVRGEKILDQTSNMKRGKDVVFSRRILETNTSIALTICNFSEREGADLIILGDRTEVSPVARLMLGSVAAGVANNASCPVLVVR